jgi:hypothetical protein
MRSDQEPLEHPVVHVHLEHPVVHEHLEHLVNLALQNFQFLAPLEHLVVLMEDLVLLEDQLSHYLYLEHLFHLFHRVLPGVQTHLEHLEVLWLLALLEVLSPLVNLAHLEVLLPLEHLVDHEVQYFQSPLELLEHLVPLVDL